jgi:uncharacterized pyridoxamine 5'-phosphate oxidase family protein
VRETADDIAWLQSVLDHSFERAGEYLRSSFRMPTHSLNAGQLVTLLDGILEVALATVTPKSEPRVAPTAALFWRGRFYVPTLAAAARVKQLRRNNAVSVTYYQRVDIAVIVHGRAGFIETPDEDFTELYELQLETSGQSVRGWGEDPLYIRVDPDVVYTFAREATTIAEYVPPAGG